MKFLRTLGYLATIALQWGLVSLQGKQNVKVLRGKPNRALLVFIGIAMLVSSFIQFWMLTGLFPYILLLVLIGASIAADMLSLLLGALAGFDVEGKKEKIRILPLIWAVQRPARGCAFLLVCFLYWIVSTILCLWIFWRHRLGDPIAVGWIAFIDFIIPPLLLAPFEDAMSWPVVTSEFVDDDVRNAYLSLRFSKIFSSTIVLVFPAWVFREQLGNAFGHLPPLWILLSIPTFIFLLLSAFPFFIGMHRFRSHAKLLLEWRRGWLSQVIRVLQLPDGKNRADRYAYELQRLEAEIQRRVAENDLLSFYQRIVAPDLTEGPRRQIETDAIEPASGGADNALHKSGEVVVESPNTVKGDAMKRIGDLLSGPLTPVVQPPGAGADQIMEIVKEHKERLVEWDVRFGHLSHLLNLYRSSQDSRPEEIRAYLETELTGALAEADTGSRRKNVLAGSFLSASSAGIVWVFKTYQSQIIDVIGRIAHGM